MIYIRRNDYEELMEMIFITFVLVLTAIFIIGLILTLFNVVPIANAACYVNISQESLVPSSDFLRDKIIELSSDCVGLSYVYGGTSKEGFDCSGFVQYVMKEAGIEVSRVCADQYNDGEHIENIDDLLAGDIVIFKNTYISGISHSGIYIGNNEFIHAANSRDGVKISSLDEEYYSKRFVSGVRVIK